MTYDKTILITGGAGFIGSHVVRHFVKTYPNYLIVNFDKLTYAGNLENLSDITSGEYPNYEFFRGDITIKSDIEDVFNKFNITDIIHLAAESHVDRSITNPNEFVNTNVFGTVNLLNFAAQCWKGEYEKHRFHHVSTDEVYGALDMNPENKFTEWTPYNPHSPYSASKASSDHFVKAYHDTFGLNVTISNCSNNYGPNQFPEKLIPLAINNLTTGKKIPIYGKGENVRDWLYVGDHVKAIDLIFHEGRNGETYNVGGNNELTNIELVKELIIAYYELFGDPCFSGDANDFRITNSLEFVKDRAGHDLRYAIDSSKLMNELGWKPETPFRIGISETVEWYLQNEDWLEHVTSGEYQQYYNKMYVS